MSGALEALAGLSSAEEFLEALDVPYDPAALAPRRLHVMKRFQDALAVHPDADRATLRACLEAAYHESIGDDARTRTDFAVFRQARDGSGRAFVPLSALAEAPPRNPG